MTKVLVLAFDGAEWDIINPMIEKGELPNIQKLMKEGSYGDMESVHPYISPSIWTTIFTGKRVDKHGIVDFYSSYRDLKSDRIWEILENKGKTVGVFNLISVWKARETNGFLIPGTLSLSTETSPKELEFIKSMRKERKTGEISKLKLLDYGIESIKYGANLKNILDSVKVVFDKFRTENFLDYEYKERMLELDLHTSIFMNLWKKYTPDFSIFYTNAGDRISHKYWRYYEPESFESKLDEVRKYRDVIPNFYKKFDKNLGRILDMIDDDTYLFLLSDHGFEAIEHEKKRDTYFIKAQGLLEEIGLDEDFYPVNIAELALYRPKKGRKIKKLKRILEKMQFKEKRIFNVKQKKNHLEVSLKNNLGFRVSDKVIANGREYHCSKFIGFNISQSGQHSNPALIIIKGKNIKQNYNTNLHIMDVTPTILHIFGEEIPKGMDGEIKKDIFT